MIRLWIEQILKLQSTPAKSRGTGVGQVVGHVVQIHLLRHHAAGCGVK
jgi:hypothetical protein